MAQLKRLAKKDEEDVAIQIPLSSSEISDRVLQYVELDPSRFSKRYNDLLYRPVSFTLNGEKHQIQYNF